MNTHQAKNNKAYGLSVFLEEMDKNGKPTLIGCPDKDGTYSNGSIRKKSSLWIDSLKTNPKGCEDGSLAVLHSPVLH